MFVFVLLTLGVILYITIIHILLYYYYYIIYYTYTYIIIIYYILYYTLPFLSSSLLSSVPPLLFSSLLSLLFSHPPFILYVSVLTYGYLYSIDISSTFIFLSSSILLIFYSQSFNNLTPHKLTEWMVEV